MPNELTTILYSFHIYAIIFHLGVSHGVLMCVSRYDAVTHQLEIRGRNGHNFGALGASGS